MTKEQRGPAPEWATEAMDVINAAASQCTATLPEDIYEGLTATIAVAEAVDSENDRIKILMIVMAKLWKAGHAAAQRKASAELEAAHEVAHRVVETEEK